MEGGEGLERVSEAELAGLGVCVCVCVCALAGTLAKPAMQERERCL